MLGEELRRAREKAKMTQERLAFAANIDRSYISLLENNHKSPTVDVLFRLCDALGTAPSVLLARVEKTRKPKAQKK
jgi:transcriptional regulator with XRE-family HTH domain